MAKDERNGDRLRVLAHPQLVWRRAEQLLDAVVGVQLLE